MRRNDEEYRATQTIQTEDASSIPNDDASTFRDLPKNDSKFQRRAARDGRSASILVPMCRNIRPLFNFEPPATDDDIRAASIQFVRKISGSSTPSHANEAAYLRAVDDIADAARALLDSLVTTAPPRDRNEWTEKAKARSAERFAQSRA